jgi:hypothetical protein
LYSSNIFTSQSLEINTGIVVKCNSLKELAMTTNIPYDHVRAIVESVTPKKSNGYHFRFLSNKPWPKEFVNLVTYPKRSFKIKNKKSKEEIYINSLSELIKFLSITKKTAYQILKNEREHPIYQIKELI